MDGYASNAKPTVPVEPTLENDLKNLRGSLSEIAAASHRLADRLGGPRPEAATSEGKAIESNSLLATIRDLQREADYIRNHLSRAENYLG